MAANVSNIIPKWITFKKINSFYSKDKNRNKYRVIVTPPYTLIQAYSAYFKGKKITIGAQNCYQKEFWIMFILE